MKKVFVIIASFLSCAFFCVRGAFFSVCPLALCARGLNLPSGVKAQCYSEAYLYKSSSGCKVVRLSGGFCKVSGEGGLLSAAKSVKGERFFVPSNVLNGGLGFEELRDFFVKSLLAKKVFCEKADGAYNEYYYSRAIKNYSVINGKRVNLQICKTAAGVSVASPIAFGSY